MRAYASTGIDLISTSAPITRSRASQIIREIKLVKRVAFLRARAERAGKDPATIERLIALVQTAGLAGVVLILAGLVAWRTAQITEMLAPLGQITL